MTAATLAAALLLGSVHLFAPRLKFLHVQPRSRWLSAGGGVSLAYVFVHLLPELDRSQEVLREAASDETWLGFLEHHVYLVAMIGLLVFYGVEHLVCEAKSGRAKDESTLPTGIFWVHIGSFGLYNALFGYLLLHREEQGYLSLIEFAFAIAVHLMVNDFGLWRHHRRSYTSAGRWCLAAAVLVGWTGGVLIQLHEPAVAVIFGLLSGAIILNVLKEELPSERESRYWALAAGAAGYSAVLMLA